MIESPCKKFKTKESCENPKADPPRDKVCGWREGIQRSSCALLPFAAVAIGRTPPFWLHRKWTMLPEIGPYAGGAEPIGRPGRAGGGRRRREREFEEESEEPGVLRIRPVRIPSVRRRPRSPRVKLEPREPESPEIYEDVPELELDGYFSHRPRRSVRSSVTLDGKLRFEQNQEDQLDPDVVNYVLNRHNTSGKTVHTTDRYKNTSAAVSVDQMGYTSVSAKVTRVCNQE